MTIPTVSAGADLILYYIDTRISLKNFSDNKVLSLDEETTTKVSDTVCDFFKLHETWDKKLFGSVLSIKEFDWFELIRRDNPNVLCGLHFLGDKRVVEMNPSETFEIVKKEGRKIRLNVVGLFKQPDCELSFEDLKSKNKIDPSVVALYNSESFFHYSQSSTREIKKRTYEVIDLKPTGRL